MLAAGLWPGPALTVRWKLEGLRREKPAWGLGQGFEGDGRVVGLSLRGPGSELLK